MYVLCMGFGYTILYIYIYHICTCIPVSWSYGETCMNLYEPLKEPICLDKDLFSPVPHFVEFAISGVAKGCWLLPLARKCYPVICNSKGALLER